MSELALPRVAKSRPARVWQPLELPFASALQKGFVPAQWAAPSSRTFWQQEVPTAPASSAESAPSLSFEAPGAGDIAASSASVDGASEPAPERAPGPTQEMLDSVRAQAYAQGVADTRLSLQAETAQELLNLQAQNQSMLGALETALQQLKRSPQEFFEPLKRLALHLAEQLVLAELGIDGKAIERLVQRCVDELSSHDESMIMVELHPADLALLEALRERLGLNRGQPLKFKADASLLPGSVRASANDAMVQDLIEHRLVELARALGVDQARWKSNSAFESERLTAERAAGLRGVEDALPRMAAAGPLTDANSFEDQAEQDVHDA